MTVEPQALEPQPARLFDLLERVAGGDESALAAIYDATSRPVHGLIRRIVGDPEVAEEVTQDVYLQVWRRAEAYDASRGSPLAWLFTIARSRAVDRLRAGAGRRSQERSLDRDWDAVSPSEGPDCASEGQERRGLVLGALARLPAAERRAIELAYLKGMTHVEIAEWLELPLGTVKTRVRRAAQRLRRLLEPLRDS